LCGNLIEKRLNLQLDQHTATKNVIPKNYHKFHENLESGNTRSRTAVETDEESEA